MTKLALASVFKNNEALPAKYTCQGEKINPELNISNIPTNAKTLVLILDDPDAPHGTFVHWVLFNIPLVNKISENSIPSGAIVGKNSVNENKYFPPCPPTGVHRYTFKLYALDSVLALDKNAAKSDVENAMKGHIIEQAQLVGLYSKK